jgi:ABC-type thiamin/hydroxymethylpyrimidine transport system permease subunit
MSILSTMRDDVKRIGSLDIMLAVVFAVIVRVYMIIGSPLVNLVLHGMGPVGDILNVVTLLVPLYVLLMLPGAMRSNGLTAMLTAVLQSLIRTLTGDAFGIVALQSYFVGGFIAWVCMAAFQYKRTYLHWISSAFCWTFGVDMMFAVYIGIFPLFGSMVLGILLYAFVERFLNAIIVGPIILLVLLRLSRVESVRGIMTSSTPK